MGDAHRPGTDGSTNLNFAGSGNSEVLQLLRSKVRGGDQERHLDGVVLRSKEVIPAELVVPWSVRCGDEEARDATNRWMKWRQRSRAGWPMI